jgi:hypothetical protein
MVREEITAIVAIALFSAILVILGVVFWRLMV